jgi:hypothetical protein
MKIRIMSLIQLIGHIALKIYSGSMFEFRPFHLFTLRMKFLATKLFKRKKKWKHLK